MSEKWMIDLQQITFGWPDRPALLEIPQLSIEQGERIFIHGPSGCGKTTLLNLIAGIHPAPQGSITLNGEQLNTLSGSQRDRFRADHIGLIFQQFNLLPYLSVQANVELPCQFSKIRRERAEQRYGSVAEAGLSLLQELGLSGLLQQPVTDLSIGQQQRVAAARALIGSPEIIIADEPTSSLDSANRAAFIELLINECDQNGSTLLFVSHDQSLAQQFPRQIDLLQLNRAGEAV
ncbi:MAG: ABC transporter ATP-binding protein [Amphritea sp.]|nr:ABC transporter ATP-binding protein [Amphritea sp.]